MELVITMAVAAVFAAVLSMPILSMGGNLVNAAASKIAFDMRYAQQLAVNTNGQCGVSFNITNNRYSVYIGTTSNLATDPFTRKPMTTDLSIEKQYRGVRLISTNFNNRIYFDYMGRPYNNSNALLTSQGVVTIRHGTTNKTVTIQPNTGEIKVQ